MKMVLIGAGSYVFAPVIIYDAIKNCNGRKLELALVDLNLAMAEKMAGLGRFIAADLGEDCLITASADRTEVLAGADFVALSASPRGASCWQLDAVKKSRQILEQALMLDKTIPEKETAMGLLHQQLDAHSELHPGL